MFAPLQVSSATRGFHYDVGTWFIEEQNGKKSLVSYEIAFDIQGFFT